MPQVEEMRVLGMVINHKGNNTNTIKKLATYADQVQGIFRRIAVKGRGLKERSLLRISQAYITSRICYATPYLNMNKENIDKLDRILRKCAKRALGLPISTSTERLEKMGIHNRWAELAEGVRIAQLERLSQSETGRKILEWIDIKPGYTAHKTVDIPEEIRARIRVPPMPKNMHPEYNKERRGHRARAYEKRMGEQPAEQVAYVDAACGRQGAAVSAVVDGTGAPVVSASSRTRDANAAEELAVALACVGTKAKFILCDSKNAVRNFGKGRISEEAKRVLESRPLERNVEIIWIPAHESIAGNEAAHEFARALYHRAAAEQPSCMDIKDSLISYKEVTEHYKLSRRSIRRQTVPSETGRQLHGGDYKGAIILVPFGYMQQFQKMKRIYIA